MCLFDDILRVAADEGARGEINPLLTRLGLRLGLSFVGAVKGKKRIVRRLAGGVLTFDDRRLPVPLFGSHNVDTTKEVTDAALTKDEAGVGEGRRRTDRVHVALDWPETNDTSGTAGLVGPVSNDREVNTNLLTDRREGISFTKDSRGERI
jgi:hypothetical protein